MPLSEQYKKRARARNTHSYQEGAICYWMDRDMRLQDNWALLAAQEIANEKKVPLIIIYNLVADFLGGTTRQFKFKVSALKELEKDAIKKNISLYVMTGDPVQDMKKIISELGIGCVVTDFSPLKIQQQWKQKIAKEDIPLIEVDAHNIIPAWVVSDKQEFAAYTIRPKVHRLLPEYLTEIPKLKKHSHGESKEGLNDWKSIEGLADELKQVSEVQFKSGEKAAHKQLQKFIDERLKNYAEDRNDPVQQAVSDISPYFHYGMISPQRVALKVDALEPLYTQSVESFLEEMIVRKELADNFCLYNPNYDNENAAPNWAAKSIAEHKNDPREYLYSQKEFEEARTHDPLWNAAQIQMLETGKMHGFMRMYWAKKILEWTANTKEAMKIAIYLNDTYEIDGRDPSGYTGIAWSILGVHDRAWFDREIFGKIRYMNDSGCKRKFDVKAYIAQWNRQQQIPLE